MNEGIKNSPVAGYQDQSETKVALVNRNKYAEEGILRVLDVMRESDDVDKRWLAIGRTHIEQGFMAINRAIFQPKRLSDDGTSKGAGSN